MARALLQISSLVEFDRDCAQRTPASSPFRRRPVAPPAATVHTWPLRSLNSGASFLRPSVRPAASPATAAALRRRLSITHQTLGYNNHVYCSDGGGAAAAGSAKPWPAMVPRRTNNWRPYSQFPRYFEDGRGGGRGGESYLYLSRDFCSMLDSGFNCALSQLVWYEFPSLTHVVLCLEK